MPPSALVTPPLDGIIAVPATPFTDVPKAESAMMAAALKRNSVKHQLSLVPGAEPGLKGSDPAVIVAMDRAAADFLRLRLKPRSNSR